MEEAGSEGKEHNTIVVLDLVLLNVSGEAMAKALWDKLGTLYQSKSLVNKLFVWKKLYNLRMKDGVREGFVLFG